MLASQELIQELQNKWEHILCKSCIVCKGEKYVLNNKCKCLLKAEKYARLEAFNIPMKALRTNKEHINKIDFDFEDYFKNIRNEIYNVPNLYFYKFNNDLKLEIVGYIAKKLINTPRVNGTHNTTVYYVIFENLIQMALRSNIDRDARNQMNEIIKQPYILFVDGIGTETGFNSPTKHNVKLLNLLLKERNNRCKSTIILSDLNLTQMEQFYGKETMSFLQNYQFVKE